jgi:EAL domain-containing protein (putative c-di-GMP-specific phosphodiesterase class I)
MGKNLISTTEEVSNKGGESTSASTDIIGGRLLQGDCLYAVYQPIFHLAEERVVGYEFLGRCTIENFEMPHQFLGFSLENNMLTHVDLQCLKISIATATALKFKARFHVNLFPSTMLATPVENLLKIFPTESEGETFCLEISEQQFIGDPAHFKEYVVALKEAGILVAIDDLGFGRSSLESLIILEPDLVKIDRAYVNGIADDRGKRRSLERMIKILDGLGAERIAEGIETKEDLNILKEMGVIYGQGYLWGKPTRIQPEMHKPLKDTDVKECKQHLKLVRY